MNNLYIFGKRLQEEKSGISHYLPMTPAALASVDRLGLPYYSLDNFFSPENFRNYVYAFIDELPIQFRRLERDLEYPIFTWNIYWWIVFFANFFYMKEIAKGIEDGEFNPIFQDTPEELFNARRWSTFEFTSNELNFYFMSFGLNTKFALLSEFFDVYKKGYRAHMNRHFDFFKAIKSNVLRKDCVWIAQDGYLVSDVQKLNYNFFNVIDYMNLNTGQEQNEVCPDFVINFFTLIDSRLAVVAEMYYSSMIGAVAYWKDWLMEAMDKYTPKAVLFSVGANRLNENLVAYVANKKGIPILYFEHCPYMWGTFINHVYGSRISKTVIKKKEDRSSSLVQRGSMFYGRDDKVLYVCATPNYHAYKDLLYHYSDYQNFQRHKELISACKYAKKQLHVKVHPTEWETECNYWNVLKSTFDYKELRIVNGKCEDILHKYKFIVVDYLTSGVSVPIMCQNAILIYFAPSTEFVPNEILNGLFDEVFYFVDNGEDLLNLLDTVTITPKGYSLALDRLTFENADSNFLQEVRRCIDGKNTVCNSSKGLL